MGEDATRSSGSVDLTGRHRGLGRRAAVVSLFTLLSRILGFVREMVSAALFGDRSPVYDAFITAWRVPNLFRRFLGEGALSTSFQTSMTELEGDRGEAAGRALFRRTFILVGVLTALLTLGVMLLVSWIPDRMPLTGWAWLGEDPAPVRDLVTRLMPFVVLVCLTALSTGALHVRGIFGPPAFAPVALNVLWIATLVAVAQRYGWVGDGVEASYARHLDMVHLLAHGVLLAGLVQFLVQVPALRRTGLVGRATFAATPDEGGLGSREGALAVLRRSAPLAFGAAVYQINVMLDGFMAEAMLPNGGPTLHYLANRVQQFPLALIAVAATSAVFPALQAYGHKGDRAAVRKLHDRTHRSIAFVALPATVGLFVLAGPVTSVAFEHGAFGADGVERTARALRMLTLAILPAGATGLVARTYYSLGDFRTPVRVSSLMLCINVLLNYVAIRVFDLDVDGLALATTITSWASLGALWPGLRGRLGLPAGEGGHLSSLGRTAVAALLCGAAAWGVERWLSGVFGATASVGLAIVIGVVTFAVSARAFGVPEAETIAKRLRRR